jgi:hypothetical protein
MLITKGADSVIHKLLRDSDDKEELGIRRDCWDCLDEYAT